MQKRILFLLIAVLFCTGSFAANCDTLFVAQQAELRYGPTLDSLGFDSAECVQKFATPEGCFYRSALPGDDGAYRLAFRTGKSWVSWQTGIEDIELGRFYFNWQQVDGKGGPELLIWACDDFGHHAATHASEDSDYSLQVWDVEHGILLLEQWYRWYSWYADMDFGGPTDSAGNPWPPSVDERLGLTLYTKKLFITDSTRVKAMTFPTEAAADSTQQKPDAYRIDPCPDKAGVYRFTKGAWIRTSETKVPKGPVARPPGHHPYWEWF